MTRQATSWTMVALIATCVWPVQAAKRVEARPEAARSPHQVSHVVVKFRPGAAAYDRMLLNRKNGFQIDRTIDQLDMHVVRIPLGKTVEEVVARYERNPNVEFA